MTSAFSHDDAFQTIERLINELHRSKRDFVPHRLIAKTLLIDELGSKLIQEALRTNQNFTDRGWASNMVAWFSKIFTERLPASAKRFDRIELHDRYAYKPPGSTSLAREFAKQSSKPLAMFTFGYWGWGSATQRLIQSADSVEESRGFKPPTFVDIRIQRVVRAEGFKEDGFEKLLGDKRHRWMHALGNLSITEDTGERIKIKEPEAADELLDIALTSALDNRRVIFFCSCEWPRDKAKQRTCHRTVVAKLLLRAAKERGVPIEVSEWPGGDPVEVELKVSPEVIAAARQGKMTIALGQRLPSPTLLGLPWCSIITLRSGKDRLRTTCGPAKYCRNEWCLPVRSPCSDPETDAATMHRKAVQQRKAFGLNSNAVLKHDNH